MEDIKYFFNAVEKDGNIGGTCYTSENKEDYLKYIKKQEVKVIHEEEISHYLYEYVGKMMCNPTYDKLKYEDILNNVKTKISFDENIDYNKLCESLIDKHGKDAYNEMKELIKNAFKDEDSVAQLKDIVKNLVKLYVPYDEVDIDLLMEHLFKAFHDEENDNIDNNKQTDK